MKLTVGKIHDLYVGLTMLERDDKIKLAGETRFKMAINLNLLQPIAAAYEIARTCEHADVQKKHRGPEPRDRISDEEIEAEMAAKNGMLRGREEEITLRMLKKDDLKLDDNQTLGHVTLAKILPIVEGGEV